MTEQEKIQEIIDVCKYALDAVEDSELYPQEAADKLVGIIAKYDS